eukprot:TRINITY_DN58161_c0_g1_i1.p1 TRINITY_DN58161_c0_g1~~TRINITY_DN58161_c0_g1_i1.p1  ORF type:complete len:438 (-),score=56.04 TRINITY_DN58161_c0_g1_i1:125-1438(-)
MDVPRINSFNVATHDELTLPRENPSESPEAVVYPRAQSFAAPSRPRPEALLAWQQAVWEISHSDARVQQSFSPPTATKQVDSPQVIPAMSEVNILDADARAQLTLQSPSSTEHMGSPEESPAINEAGALHAIAGQPGHSAIGANLAVGPPPSLQPAGLRELSMDSSHLTPTSAQLTGSPRALPPMNEFGSWQDISEPNQSPAGAKLLAGSPGARPAAPRESSLDCMPFPDEPSWPSSPSPSMHASGPLSVAGSPGQLSFSCKHQDGRDLRQTENYCAEVVEDTSYRLLPKSIAKATIVRCSPDRRRCTPRNPFWSRRSADIRNTTSSSNNMLSCTGAPLRCISEVVDAADRDQEIEVREDDLTTVHISSLEQRLAWQGFLTQAAAASLARKAFKNFDVEAEPPAYARPPPSARGPPGESVTQASQFMQDDKIYSFTV